MSVKQTPSSSTAAAVFGAAISAHRLRHPDDKTMKLHTSREVAAALRISLSGLRALWARGDGPRQTRFGRTLRVSECDL